jgi:aspartate oxidase
MRARATYTTCSIYSFISSTSEWSKRKKEKMEREREDEENMIAYLRCIINMKVENKEPYGLHQLSLSPLQEAERQKTTERK